MGGHQNYNIVFPRGENLWVMVTITGTWHSITIIFLEIILLIWNMELIDIAFYEHIPHWYFLIIYHNLYKKVYTGTCIVFRTCKKKFYKS